MKYITSVEEKDTTKHTENCWAIQGRGNRVRKSNGGS
jgi:hypothetical protein